ncbi:MAG: hypothetical protein K8W52_18110 [Deltaproteobacteria bacterium]|nr:hypothetical protein [Deltaproteobacteria bacterium]
MKLGTLLLRNAAVSLTQLEAGLRAQVLYGGRLGTNLVELGFLDVDGLGQFLGELTGLPVATAELLEHATPEALAAIGPTLADQHGAIGLHIRPDGVLAVAVVDPSDTATLHELAVHANRPIAPHVVAELRLLYYLERHYRIARKARYVRPGTRRTLVQADERRRTQPAAGLVLPPQVRLEPRKKPAAPIAEPPEPVPVRVDPIEAAADATDRSTAPPEATAAAPALLPYRGACDRIDQANHRDQIAAVLVEFAIGRFEALIAFLVRDANALGWRGRIATPRGLTAPLESLALPLGGASALQAAHDSLRPFRGPSPSAAHPIEQTLWTVIGAEPPPIEVLVTPIIVKQRVVNLIYAHAPGGERLPDVASDELCELAVRASTAYVRLIRQSKHTLTGG